MTREGGSRASRAARPTRPRRASWRRGGLHRRSRSRRCDSGLLGRWRVRLGLEIDRHVAVALARPLLLRRQRSSLGRADEALQLLAPPQLLEDVNFAGPLPSLPATVSTKLAFNVDAASLQRAEANYADAFANERQLQSLLVKEDGSKASAAATSADIAAKFSGLAMWPTLVLDDDAATLVKSRGAKTLRTAP